MTVVRRPTIDAGANDVSVSAVYRSARGALSKALALVRPGSRGINRFTPSGQAAMRSPRCGSRNCPVQGETGSRRHRRTGGATSLTPIAIEGVACLAERERRVAPHPLSSPVSWRTTQLGRVPRPTLA